MPIIPMVLVNGAEGIGTGWKTKIPNYSPRELVANIRLMLDGEEPVPMIPWYKNFRETTDMSAAERLPWSKPRSSRSPNCPSERGRRNTRRTLWNPYYGKSYTVRRKEMGLPEKYLYALSLTRILST